MPNYMRNRLIVTGPNPAAVIEATTQKFTETDDAYKFEETGAGISYFTGYAVGRLDPTLKNSDNPTRVFPDEQKLTVTEDKVVVSFTSAWHGPAVEVQTLSKLFPDNMFRLLSWGVQDVRLVLLAFKNGKGFYIDPREEWNNKDKTLAAKYLIEMPTGVDSLTGTIVIDGQRRPFTCQHGFGRGESGVLTPEQSKEHTDKVHQNDEQGLQIEKQLRLELQPDEQIRLQRQLEEICLWRFRLDRQNRLNVIIEGIDNDALPQEVEQEIYDAVVNELQAGDQHGDTPPAFQKG